MNGTALALWLTVGCGVRVASSAETASHAPGSILLFICAAGSAPARRIGSGWLRLSCLAAVFHQVDDHITDDDENQQNEQAMQGARGDKRVESRLQPAAILERQLQVAPPSRRVGGFNGITQWRGQKRGKPVRRRHAELHRAIAQEDDAAALELGLECAPYALATHRIERFSLVHLLQKIFFGDVQLSV